MLHPIQRVSLVGLGKLGTPMAACFAARGYPTWAVDVDARKVEAIRDGKAPLYEPGLQEMLEAGRERLQATQDLERAVLESDATFVVVATPSESNGGFSLRYALKAFEGIGEALRKKEAYHLVVLTSTVMPGSTDGPVRTTLEERSGKRMGRDFGLCYNPEFIALGSVLRDFLNPDFLLIGESDTRAGESLAAFLTSLCENKPAVARMTLVNAELTKLAVNTFVTTKISFANMLARICERLPGANIDGVTNALGLDSRIGRKYLKGAISYGGPCFPRDNHALACLARALGAPDAIADATDSFNEEQLRWLATAVRERLPRGGQVAILGLSYKPHSDVVECAPGFMLAQTLAKEGVSVVAYDPIAMPNARSVLKDTVAFAASADECVRRADVVVLATPWEDFKRLNPDDWAPGMILIDCWRLFGDRQFRNDLRYVPLGVGTPAPSREICALKERS